MKDITPACLFVAAKMEDTAKKAKDILLVIHSLRNPQSADINADSPVIEEQRRRVLGLERMILETQSFDFRHRHPQSFIIKFAKVLRIPRERTKEAWYVSLDSYRSWLPLKLPPHAIALACILLAIKFTGETIEIEPSDFGVSPEHLYIALEDLLDHYIHSKSQTSAITICDEGRLMEIKSSLIRGRTDDSVKRSNGHSPIRTTENLSSIGDRGTCRYILDPERMDDGDRTA